MRACRFESALPALQAGADFVYIHIEAPDECGHRHELENKVRSIELIDASGRIVSHTASLGTQVALSLDGLANGFWTARITLADERVVVRPFVKQP